MSHGVLFRGGKEAAIRECLVGGDLLEAVIGLPKNLFYSTPIPVCLLIFRNAKPEERRNKILFIDASARFQNSKNQNTMSEGDVELIDAAYKQGVDVDETGGLFMRLVDMAEVEANSYDLNIGRYIKAETNADTNVESALNAYRQAREQFLAVDDLLEAKLKAAGFHA